MEKGYSSLNNRRGIIKMNIKSGKYLKWKTWEKYMNRTGECLLCGNKKRCMFCKEVLQEIVDMKRKRMKENMLCSYNKQ
jgi:hypothetical protein